MGFLLTCSNVDEKIEVDFFALLPSDFLKEEPLPAPELLLRAFIYFLLFLLVSEFFEEEEFIIEIVIEFAIAVEIPTTLQIFLPAF